MPSSFYFQEREITSFVSSVLLECVTAEKLEILKTYLQVYQVSTEFMEILRIKILRLVSFLPNKPVFHFPSSTRRFRQAVTDLDRCQNPLVVQEIKLVLTYYRKAFPRLSEKCSRKVKPAIELLINIILRLRIAIYLVQFHINFNFIQKVNISDMLY